MTSMETCDVKREVETILKTQIEALKTLPLFNVSFSWRECCIGVRTKRYVEDFQNVLEVIVNLIPFLQFVFTFRKYEARNYGEFLDRSLEKGRFFTIDDRGDIVPNYDRKKQA